MIAENTIEGKNTCDDDTKIEEIKEVWIVYTNSFPQFVSNDLKKVEEAENNLIDSVIKKNGYGGMNINRSDNDTKRSIQLTYTNPNSITNYNYENLGEIVSIKVPFYRKISE